MKATIKITSEFSEMVYVNVHYKTGIVRLRNSVRGVIANREFDIMEMPCNYSRKKFFRMLSDQLQGKKFKKKLYKVANARHNYSMAEKLKDCI